MGVFGGGGVFALAGAGALHAAFAVVAVAGQAVAQQIACGVVLLSDAGGGRTTGAGSHVTSAPAQRIEVSCDGPLHCTLQALP